MNDTSRIRGCKPAVPLRKEDAAMERMDDELCTIDLWDNLVKDNLSIGTSAMPSSMEKLKATGTQAKIRYGVNGKKVRRKPKPEVRNLKANHHIAKQKFTSMHVNGKGSTYTNRSIAKP